MSSGVYEIVNAQDGNRYVGSSWNIEKRWGDHRRDLECGKHHSRYLQRAWLKHGPDIFQFRILLICNTDALLESEQRYIDTLCPKYNMSLTAGSPLGFKHSPEARQNMSMAHIGKKYGPQTPEHRAKLSASQPEHLEWLGRKHTDESRAKMSIAQAGRKLSPEHCAKISAIKSGKKLSAETRAKMSASAKGKSHKHYRLRGSPSIETREKISAGLLARRSMKGNEECST